jgi:guanylate kinase
MKTPIINILIISAPSGAGKTTLIEHLGLKHRFRYSISHTTRVPRENEQDEVHYHFVSQQEFARLEAAGAFVETTQIHGHSYGTSWKNFTASEHADEWLLLDLDVKGLRSLREKIKDLVSVFILPPSIDTLKDRILSRQLDISQEELSTRLETARTEIKYVFEYDYSVFNMDLSKATEELSIILQAERMKNKRKKVFLDSLLY